MASVYGFRKMKVFKDVPANTPTQVDELFGVGGYGYIEVTNMSGNDVSLTLNSNLAGGMTGSTIIIPFSDTPIGIPLMTTNFVATDVITVVAYGM